MRKNESCINVLANANCKYSLSVLGNTTVFRIDDLSIGVIAEFI